MKKVIKWFGFVLMVCGFVFMLGTAGASDIDAICIDMVIVRSFIALAMVVTGFIVAYIMEKKEIEK